MKGVFKMSKKKPSADFVRAFSDEYSEYTVKITKVKPFRDRKGRYGLETVGRIDSRRFIKAWIPEPECKYIIKGHTVTLKGIITGSVDYGNAVLFLMVPATASGDAPQFAPGYGYQEPLFA